MYDDFDQGGKFFTDSNGLSMLQREHNHKKTLAGSKPAPDLRTKLRTGLAEPSDFGNSSSGFNFSQVSISD